MWQPMKRTPPPYNAALTEKLTPGESIEVWSNDLYEVIKRTLPDGSSWLSINRWDREAIHDWRHFQQIKNEVCDPEQEGIELYPAESRLADSSNQYHLWVMPLGTKLPIGFGEGLVTTDEQGRKFTDDPGHKGKQRPHEDGLTTGRGEQTPYMDDEQFAAQSRKVRASQ